MKPLSIVDIYARTQELFRNSLPALAVSNLRGDPAKLAEVIKRNNQADLRRVVFLGNVIGPRRSYADVEKIIETLVDGKAVALRGPMEETLLLLAEAIAANNEEDLRFHSTVFFSKMNGATFLRAFTTSKEAKEDLSLAEDGRDIDAFIRLWSAVPKGVTNWISSLPTALLFTNASTIDSWETASVVIMSYGQNIGFEDDPSSLIVSPHRACRCTSGYSGVPMAWIPFVLFPEKIKKAYIRMAPIYVFDKVTKKYIMAEGPIPSIRVAGHIIATPDSSEEICMATEFRGHSSIANASEAWAVI